MEREGMSQVICIKHSLCCTNCNSIEQRIRIQSEREKNERKPQTIHKELAERIAETSEN